MSTNIKKIEKEMVLERENLEVLVNKNNSKIIQDSVKALELEDKNRVLELGHGRCSHLSFLMDQAAHIKYFGMEISKDMLEEANKLNARYIKKKEALFQLYDGLRVPYVHNIFDRILTINTIYFWEDPAEYLDEMFRVLKPGGKFVLTFMNSPFLEQLSAISKNDLFILYRKEKIEKLVANTDFIFDSIEEKVEKTENSEGKLIDRNYTVVVLSKKPRNRHLESLYS